MNATEKYPSTSPKKTAKGADQDLKQEARGAERQNPYRRLGDERQGHAHNSECLDLGDIFL